ncbi:MAG: hypothetical protein GAK31_00398 [Stenotrophomonas maltophilia]|uniref:Aspartyl protease n=1 Tax=Stenotrophomonas maltophilia TaxID=40324 RepID=A0A7V8FJG6_STEMA|nr:MAG: hypothetical protein GAK31_00398 [Stenotrophomonas maltophilia]
MLPRSVSCLLGSALLMLATTGAAHAMAREVVPIHQTRMANGDLRYSVTVQIGARAVEAQLDTGSVGLRVMPGVLHNEDAMLTDAPSKESYGSGVHLEGRIAQAEIGFGQARQRVPIQWVNSVFCDPQRPTCMASWVPQQAFLIGGGDPRKGEGYKAILGIGMYRSAAINSLLAMGGRWLVLLPLPGQREPGQLILNPTPEETQGFRAVSLQPATAKPGDRVPYWKDHALQSCIMRMDTGEKQCADSILDTGAAGFRVSAADSHPAWPEGTEAHYNLLMADGTQLGQHFRVSRKSPDYVRFSSNKGTPFTGINAGLLTYFDNAVLYDQQAGLIALRARAH